MKNNEFEIIVVVRELGKKRPEFHIKFAVPQLPRVGDYISIYRPDSERYSEDVIVRAVWWELQHPESGGSASGAEKVGKCLDIMVECDRAEGPSAGDRWRDSAAAARTRGIEVPKFEVDRISFREGERKPSR